jgi:hypothetical protein
MTLILNRFGLKFQRYKFMANPEHLKILKDGITTWNKWRIDSNEFPDLSGADLHGTNLAKAYLSQVDLGKANLSEADLSGADLEGANLCGADLSAANLRRDDLSRADLCRADLRLAYLHEADLSDARLTGARLTEADLSGAILRAANLSGANLRGADLSAANLSSANLSSSILDNTAFNRAYLDGTIFALTSLETVKGLETCDHFGPSPIDYQTLMESGPLPDAFLRGCGLSDEFINYLPSFWNQPYKFYSCFISYSHADKVFARRLHDTLQGRSIRCWLDEHQIYAGDKIHRAIDEGIKLWDKVLLCCSEASLTSWWVDAEIQKALMKEERLSKERGRDMLAIIPLDLDGHMFNPQWQDWKKDIVTSRQALNFSDWRNDDDKFNHQIENLTKALRADINARAAPPQPLL